MADTDLTTLAAVKQWLALTTQTDDPLLSSLITAASGFVEDWCERRFGIAAYTEIRDGTGGRRLTTLAAPLTGVSGVTIDGVAIAASDGRSYGYVWTDTAITLIGTVFTRGLSNIGLSYTAGFAVVPPAVERAVIDLIALRYRERDRVGVASKAMAGETTSYVIRDMTPAIVTALQPYRRVSLS